MISIVGAGPAGLFCGYLLAKKGLDVTIFDQKKSVGLPIQCTGIVTSKIKDLIELDESIIINHIKNIEVHSKNKIVKISLQKPDLVLDRKKFDQYIEKMATTAGAKVQMNRRLLKVTDNSIILKNTILDKEDTVEFDKLIGADGPLSKIHNKLNPNTKRKFYRGIQVRVKGNFEKDTFQVHLGSICPDFFAWVVPESNAIARVGLASKNNPKVFIKKFLEKLDLKKVIEIQAGLIPMYDKKIKTKEGNTYLLGDAAGQIKSSTGGGIVQGLKAAKCLADSIANNTCYEKEWKKTLNKDLWIHLMIRDTLNKFTDKDYDKLTSALENKKVKEILETNSRDSPSKFMIKLMLAKPSLMTFAKKLF